MHTSITNLPPVLLSAQGRTKRQIKAIQKPPQCKNDSRFVLSDNSLLIQLASWIYPKANRHLAIIWQALYESDIDLW